MSTFDSERPDDIPEKVWRQLTALIARAEHPNTPESEAELCNEQIQRLMLKWQISDAMAADTQKEPTVVIEDTINLTGKNTTHKAQLLYGIARVFNCKVISIMEYRKSSTNELRIMGRKQDIAMAWTLFEHLLIQLNAKLQGLYLRDMRPADQQRYRKGYIIAFANRVSARLQEMYHEEVVTSGTGTEIVLASIKTAVDDFATDLYPNLRTGNPISGGSWEGAIHGREDAESADIFLPGARFDAKDEQAELEKARIAIGS